ncbi:ATP-binding protein [Bdellovibrionota bacterium FG-1]
MSKKAVFRTILDEDPLLLPEHYLTRNLPCPEPILHKAISFIGVRRSGKSSFLNQIKDQWLSRGLPPHAIGYLNFADERLFGLQASELGTALDAFEERISELGSTPQAVLFLDEIQEIEGWELFANRLLRRNDLHIYLTGSSSKLLSHELATQMRGRSLAFEVYPFSFHEFSQFHKLEGSRAKRSTAMKKYLHSGGFPEIQSSEPRIQRRILQDYSEVLLLRDIVERHEVSNIPLIKTLFLTLFNQVGSLFTINRLHDRLKSLGLKGEKSLLTEALGWFEDCYALFTLPMYSESFSKQNANPKKIYAIDSGLVTAVNSGLSDNTGHLLENQIFIHLKRMGETKIFYYKTHKGGLEVDFFVAGKHLIQVCADFSDPITRQRELLALEQAMEELKIRSSLLITLSSDEDEIKLSSGHARVIPAIRFLLQENL